MNIWEEDCKAQYQAFLQNPLNRMTDSSPVWTLWVAAFKAGRSSMVRRDLQPVAVQTQPV